MLKETSKRLDVLYRKHHSWLLAVARNVVNNEKQAEDLVGELYVYLSEHKKPKKLFFSDSFNLKYCYSFITTRWINEVKKLNRHTGYDESHEEEDIPYNEEYDLLLEESYNEIKEELQRLKQTDKWSAAMIAEMYFFNDKLTLEEISKEIGISRSTTFLNVKKIKLHLRNKLQNPFKDDEQEG